MLHSARRRWRDGGGGVLADAGSLSRRADGVLALAHAPGAPEPPDQRRHACKCLRPAHFACLTALKHQPQDSQDEIIICKKKKFLFFYRPLLLFAFNHKYIFGTKGSDENNLLRLRIGVEPPHVRSITSMLIRRRTTRFPLGNVRRQSQCSHMNQRRSRRSLVKGRF